jgi:DNA-directed RNA polymerase subunit RPC12/RpoP
MKETLEKIIETPVFHLQRATRLQKIEPHRRQNKLDTYLLYNFEEKYLCPNCGAQMQKSYPLTSVYFCPECLSSVEETKINLDTNNICPNCGQFLDAQNECRRCGYSLGSDFD